MSDKVKRARSQCLLVAQTLVEVYGPYPDTDMWQEAIDSLILAVAEEVRERAARAVNRTAGMNSAFEDAVRSLPLDDLVKP